MARHMERAPEWFCAFLAGNSREKNRFKRDMATIRGSVVWLVRQRRQGQWTAHERAHLREMMRTASSVSPYLVIWVVPGSLLLLPFLAWFIDRRRKGHTVPPVPPAPADAPLQARQRRWLPVLAGRKLCKLGGFCKLRLQQLGCRLWREGAGGRRHGKGFRAGNGCGPLHGDALGWWWCSRA